ncbi:winged helix-turn-helix domain-containing protein [Vibrio harveyi]|nr:winged helix-turn-helix domain-containing protein [Vibrio harveyi]
MTLSNQAKKALELFNSNRGKVISRANIIEHTKWAEKTVDTYIGKKWLNTILEAQSSNTYKVILKKQMTEKEFDDLQTQVDQRVRA